MVGHSFAGITVTGVADRLKPRIRRLAFYDALVPRPGRMAAVPKDPETGEWPEWFKERQTKFVDGYKMDFFAEYGLEMLVPADDEANRAWLKRRLTLHPMKQWTDELVLRNGGYDSLPKTYIRCTGQAHRPSSEQVPGPALHDLEWDWLDLPVHRNGMMTQPEVVAGCFMGLA